MTAVENRKDYEIGRVNVTDRDDRGTRNWMAKYLISNDPNGNFAIATDSGTNQGILTVVKVQLDGGLCRRGCDDFLVSITNFGWKDFIKLC